MYRKFNKLDRFRFNGSEKFRESLDNQDSSATVNNSLRIDSINSRYNMTNQIISHATYHNESKRIAKNSSEHSLSNISHEYFNSSLDPARSNVAELNSELHSDNSKKANYCVQNNVKSSSRYANQLTNKMYQSTFENKTMSVSIPTNPISNGGMLLPSLNRIIMEEKLKFGTKGYKKFKLDLKYIKDFLSRNKIKQSSNMELYPSRQSVIPKSFFNSSDTNNSLNFKKSSIYK